MLTATSAFDTIVQGREMVVSTRLTIDLPDLAAYGININSAWTKALASISLDASNTTDLPDQVRDVAGYSTIGGSCVLAGPIGPLLKESAAWLFNPDETTSPLYRTTIKGTPVEFDVGLYVPNAAAPELLRKFTGRISTLDLDHEAGTVTFGLVDLSTDWGNLPDVPAVVTASPYNAGLTSEFPLDQIIRSVNGDSSWPATRDSAVLAVGFRSSIWPEVGTLVTNASAAYPLFLPGPFGGSGYAKHGSVLDEDAIGITYQLDGAGVTNDVTVSCLINGLPDLDLTVALAGDVTRETIISLRGAFTGIGNVSVGVGSGAGGWAAPVTYDSNSHHIAVHVNWPVGSTTWTATVWVDGVAYVSPPQTATARPAGALNQLGIFLQPSGFGGWPTIAGVQVTGETSPTFTTFTPAAVIDPSLNPLTVCPPISDGTSAWDEIQRIAGAELGYARLDENGVFRFSNRVTLGQADISRTITSASSLKKLTTSVGGTTQFDKVRVPYTEWSFSPAGLVFTLDSIKKIGKRSTVEWVQSFGDGVVAANLDLTASLLPNGHTTTDGGTWYRASSDIAGVNPHPGITITLIPVTSNTVRIKAVNGTSLDAYLTTPSSYTDLTAGSVGSGLWIGGQTATAAAEQTAEVVTGAGINPLTLTSNGYLQDHDTGLTVGAYVLNQVYVAIRDFTGVQILPDVRIQVADKDQLIDPDRSKVNEIVTVWGWGLSIDFPAAGQSGGSFDMTLNVRAVGPPGAWIGGVAGRSEGGDTTWAA